MIRRFILNTADSSYLVATNFLPESDVSLPITSSTLHPQVPFHSVLLRTSKQTTRRTPISAKSTESLVSQLSSSSPRIVKRPRTITVDAQRRTSSSS